MSEGYAKTLLSGYKLERASSIYGSFAKALNQSFYFILAIALGSFGSLSRLCFPSDDFTPVLFFFLLFLLLFRLVIMVGIPMQQPISFLSG